MRPIRVVVVDDYPDFLTVLTDVLSGVSSIRVVGLALSAEEALVLVQDLQPDVVVMDFSMPGMNGVEATSRLKALAHPPRVLLVTLHDGPAYRAQAAAAGADGFLSKSEVAGGLVPLMKALFPENRS